MHQCVVPGKPVTGRKTWLIQSKTLKSGYQEYEKIENKIKQEVVDVASSASNDFEWQIAPLDDSEPTPRYPQRESSPSGIVRVFVDPQSIEKCAEQGEDQRGAEVKRRPEGHPYPKACVVFLVGDPPSDSRAKHAAHFPYQACKNMCHPQCLQPSPSSKTFLSHCDPFGTEPKQSSRPCGGACGGLGPSCRGDTQPHPTDSMLSRIASLPNGEPSGREDLTLTRSESLETEYRGESSVSCVA